MIILNAQSSNGGMYTVLLGAKWICLRIIRHLMGKVGVRLDVL